MTYEQYGSGEFGVEVRGNDYTGRFRFESPEEARELARLRKSEGYGVRLFRTRKPLPRLSDVAVNHAASKPSADQFRCL